MKTKISIIALIVSIGLCTACTDKKSKEENPKSEVITEEKKTPVIENSDEAEKRRLDSIRQVKEHGHAH